MRRVRRRAADAELDEAEVVVVAVDAVVQAGVLGVRAFRAFGVGLEAGVLAAVVEVFLRVPELVIAEKVDLGLVRRDRLVAWRHEGLQVGPADAVFDPELGRHAREIVLVVVLDFTRRAERVLHVAAVLNLAVFAVHDQRDIVLDGHVQRVVRLAVNEGLERVAQVLRRQPRQLARDLAVRRAKHVVEARLDEGIEIAPADLGRLQRRPGHGQRVHAVLVFQLVGDKAAVLAAAARHDDVVIAVVLAMAVAQVDEFAFALGPVDLVALVVREIARRAHAVGVELDPRTLVRHGAEFAEPDGGRQLVLLHDITLFHRVTLSWGARRRGRGAHLRRSI